MEFVASSSTPSNYGRRHLPIIRRRFKPGSRPFSDRVVRALRHPLRLLHRADSCFFILGATGNVYTVSISATPSCTCPDRAAPCKHVLFVFIRVLGLPPDDHCLWRRALRRFQISRLLVLPTSDETLAGFSLRERFHQLYFRTGRASDLSDSPSRTGGGDGGACPICLEDMGREDRVVACGTCKNVIHEECFLSWKRSCRRRSATCVLCRARWRNGAGDDQEKYLNLSVYVDGDDVVPEGDIGRCT